MIVTTTNSIEGREISRYNDPIAANVVIGTNIFSDIGAILWSPLESPKGIPILTSINLKF
ncbi:heavy metal-binding domain-containing protein [Sphingobacterium sp. ML3W]|uniref:heavy metal-binding domain-containing protein n=1 Tax=Sphingobacterium sp. ML3W TaxID=1538644 RepID=UPI002838C914|nr:heavy metal-binding domain-containing protein [Sphingobacterium sp.]